MYLLSRWFFLPIMLLGQSVASHAGVGYGEGDYGSGWYGYGTVSIVSNVPTVTVPEGTLSQFSVKLSSQPPASRTVDVSRVLGSTNLVVSGGAQLVFTVGNWNQEQPVTLTASTDGDSLDDTATIRCASFEMVDCDVTAIASDRTGPSDSDADGRSNLDEYLAGTDWLNPLSLFQTSISRQGAGFTVSFDALATTPEYGASVRHYRLETISDLLLPEESWTAVPGQEDITIYGPYQYNAGLSGTQRFYRTKVWLTP